MSAIDTTFHWVRNPTAINGLATTYVSKRGSDTTGDGTAQNPYASLAKATSVATTNTNIMIDDGEWNEARTANNRGFKWWGNSNACIKGNFVFYAYDEFNYLKLKDRIVDEYGAQSIAFKNCFLDNWNSNGEYNNCVIINTLRLNTLQWSNKVGSKFINCIVFNSTILYNFGAEGVYKNNIFCNCTLPSTQQGLNCDYNNFCNSNIISSDGIANTHSINDAITGQTITDYINKFNTNSYECDFTAKEGSKNIGAGEKGTTIGLNQGYTMYADNSANDVFSALNGAILKNVEWNSTLNGYTLIQKERICQGATSTTITLDSNASAVDDYYNNLFVGIVGGDGYGELFLITDYDGTTKTATIDGSWNTTPNTKSIYTISGTILSAIKDFGKAIKVKRNWTFADNFTALTDGRWAEFMTHVETNGKQFPVSCYSYEYSTDGVNFVQGQTADDLVSATNGENKVTDAIYGDCSPNYDEATAKNLVMRYIRVRVHIGFNIGN